MLPRLKQEANSAQVKLEVHILDMRLSPANAFVKFASNHEVELMVVGSIAKKDGTNILVWIFQTR